MIKKLVVMSFFCASFSLSLLGGDVELQDAVQLANQGKYEQAIEKLKVLKRQNSADTRISLSLGLIYQQNGNYEEAIRELEYAMGLAPSAEGYYTLALLYESKLMNTSIPWKAKSIDAWEQFLIHARPDNSKIEIAKKHLNQLRHE